MSEGYGWWERALARPAPVAPGVRAKALLASAYFQYNVGDADAHFEESLALFQELGDKHGVARALHALGHLEESLALFRELGDRHGIAGSLQALGQTHESEDLLAQSLALYRELGDTGETALALEHFGALLRDKGDYARANLLFDEGLELAERLGHKDGMAWLLHSWGEMALLQGDDVSGQAREERSLAFFREAGNKRGTACVLHNLGYVAQHHGEVGEMAAYFAESLRLFQEVESTWGSVSCLAGFAGAAVHGQMARGTGAIEHARQDRLRAARLFGAAAALRAAANIRLWRAHQVEIERNVARARALLDDAAWDAAYAEGQMMTLEQAIAYALGSGDE